MVGVYWVGRWLGGGYHTAFMFITTSLVACGIIVFIPWSFHQIAAILSVDVLQNIVRTGTIGFYLSRLWVLLVYGPFTDDEIQTLLDGCHPQVIKLLTTRGLIKLLPERVQGLYDRRWLTTKCHGKATASTKTRTLSDGLSIHASSLSSSGCPPEDVPSLNFEFRAESSNARSQNEPYALSSDTFADQPAMNQLDRGDTEQLKDENCQQSSQFFQPGFSDNSIDSECKHTIVTQEPQRTRLHVSSRGGSEISQLRSSTLADALLRHQKEPTSRSDNKSLETVAPKKNEVKCLLTSVKCKAAHMERFQSFGKIRTLCDFEKLKTTELSSLPPFSELVLSEERLQSALHNLSSPFSQISDTQQEIQQKEFLNPEGVKKTWEKNKAMATTPKVALEGTKYHTEECNSCNVKDLISCLPSNRQGATLSSRLESPRWANCRRWGEMRRQNVLLPFLVRVTVVRLLRSNRHIDAFMNCIKQKLFRLSLVLTVWSFLRQNPVLREKVPYAMRKKKQEPVNDR